jgi:hypothetical protein
MAMTSLRRPPLDHEVITLQPNLDAIELRLSAQKDSASPTKGVLSDDFESRFRTPRTLRRSAAHFARRSS